MNMKLCVNVWESIFKLWMVKGWFVLVMRLNECKL